MNRALKTTVVIATVCLLAGFGWTALNVHPEAVNLTEISINPTTGDREYRGRIFTGTAHTYSSNALIREEQFVNGRRDGSFKMWFLNGNPAFEASYVKGHRHGKSTSWWSNGQLRSQTYFVDDKPDGVAWSWYRSGEKFKRYNYAEGQPAGLQQGWRRNGKLFSNFEYRNGRAYGLRNSNLCVELKDEKFELDFAR